MTKTRFFGTKVDTISAARIRIYQAVRMFNETGVRFRGIADTTNRSPNIRL